MDPKFPVVKPENIDVEEIFATVAPMQLPLIPMRFTLRRTTFGGNLSRMLSIRISDVA